MDVKENKKIHCSRCGNCCHADMTMLANKEDIKRWEKESRHDILKVLTQYDKVWAGDRIVLSNGRVLKSCPYLRWEGNLAACSIYHTRPRVCRDFTPGSSPFCPLYNTDESLQDIY